METIKDVLIIILFLTVLTYTHREYYAEMNYIWDESHGISIRKTRIT